MKPQLIIPMTGISSRFTAAGYSLPKFLLQVDGQTVIEHVLDMFPDWKDVIFCCNEIHLDNAELGLEKLLLSKRPEAKIVKVSNNQKGPAWAVLQAKEFIDLERPVVVNYCDFTCFWNSDDIASILNSGDFEGCIPAYTGFHPHMEHSTSYAYLKLVDRQVVDIQEKKPWTDDPHSEFASSGTYGFSSGAMLLESIESQIAQDIDLNGEFYLSLTYKPLLSGGGRVALLNVQHFMQWGTPQDFEEYNDTSHALSKWHLPRAGEQTPSLDMSKIVLASGAGSRFAKAGYSLPKPALPLSGKTLLEHSLISIPGNESVIVTRSDLNDKGLVASLSQKLDTHVVTLDGMSRGQADSALAGIKALDRNSPLTVTACDAVSVIDQKSVADAFKLAGDEGLVVWVSNPYHAALRKPEQYGWVIGDQQHNAVSSYIKQAPEEPGAGVIVGTFGFGSRDFAISVIEELIADGETVNGEFYLDSLVQRQIDAGKPCVILEVPSFVSVGTPSEYESVLYWQSCFDKWPLHNYKLVNDSMVSQSEIMTIAKSFREFDTMAGW